MAKIAIIHSDPVAKWSFPLMHDGLIAATKIIGQSHDVTWFLGDDRPDDSFDWIMPWGVGSMPVNDTIEQYKGRKALICAGHPQDTKNFDKFEAIFVESPLVLKQLKDVHPRVILAFGTDTEFFYPVDGYKMFDAFYPATFSPWKRQYLFATGTTGFRAMACGYVQPDGVDLVTACKSAGVHTMEGLVPTSLIAELYRTSKVTVITSWHGSERSTLEAMASNTPLVITKDNELACSLTNNEVIKVEPSTEAIYLGVFEAINKTVDTRKYVLENYTADIYASKILEVIEN